MLSVSHEWWNETLPRWERELGPQVKGIAEEVAGKIQSGHPNWLKFQENWSSARPPWLTGLVSYFGKGKDFEQDAEGLAARSEFFEQEAEAVLAPRLSQLVNEVTPQLIPKMIETHASVAQLPEEEFRKLLEEKLGAGEAINLSEIRSGLEEVVVESDADLLETLANNGGIATIGGNTYILLNPEANLPGETFLFDQVGLEELPPGVKRIPLPKVAVPGEEHLWLRDMIGPGDIVLLDSTRVGLEEAAFWKPAGVTPRAMIRIAPTTLQTITAAAGLEELIRLAERARGGIISVGDAAIENRQEYQVAVLRST